MSTKNCHSCLKQDQQSAIYSACYECQEFYCKACTDSHLKLEPTEDHGIFKLYLPAITPSVNNEDELGSDLVTTDNSDQPCAAEVAVKSREDERKRRRAALPGGVRKSLRRANPGNQVVRDISVQRPEDTCGIGVVGILTVRGKVVVVDSSNKMVKLFDDSGTYVSSTALKEDITRASTRVSDDTFATCGFDKKVYIWNIHEQTVTCSEVTYPVHHHAFGIAYNGTYYSVLLGNKTITILDGQGGHVRGITIEGAFGREIGVGYGLCMDDHSHNIYAPCWGNLSNGVLCVSIEGEPLWFTAVSYDLRGITEIRGVLCVADFANRCLHLLSKAGKYERKLLDRRGLDSEPQYICYDDQCQKLYVSFLKIPDMISVYSVTLKCSRYVD